MFVYVYQVIRRFVSVYKLYTMAASAHVMGMVENPEYLIIARIDDVVAHPDMIRGGLGLTLSTKGKQGDSGPAPNCLFVFSSICSIPVMQHFVM